MHYLFELLRRSLRKRSIDSIRRIARRFARVATPLLGTRLRVAETNARIIGVENPKAVAKSSIQQTFCSFLELYYNVNVDETFISERVTFEGEEHMDRLIESGEGFFGISGHIGCWELMVPVILARYPSAKVAGLARSMRNKKLYDHLEDVRTGNTGRANVLGARNVTTDIARHLKDGSMVAALLDHTATLKDCIMVDLFGYKATFIAGIPAMAARKKTPIAMIFAIRTEHGIHMVFEEPIRPNMELKPKERIKDIALRVNASFERIIRRYPDQWFLIHKRFNKVEMPDGSISTHVYDTPPAG